MTERITTTDNTAAYRRKVNRLLAINPSNIGLMKKAISIRFFEQFSK